MTTEEMLLIGERVRENYRLQGEERLRGRLYQAFMDDAVIRMTFTVDQVKKIIEIVEGEK